MSSSDNERKRRLGKLAGKEKKGGGILSLRRKVEVFFSKHERKGRTWNYLLNGKAVPRKGGGRRKGKKERTEFPIPSIE